MPDQVQYVTVKWTCQTCKLQEQKVEIEARREGEDVAKFVERAGYWCGRHHATKSPRCPSHRKRELRKLDIYVPLGSDGLIGTPGTASPEVIEEYRKHLKGEDEAGT